mmetsp:Transcript_3099/g.4261  ORF Transcript_3099/g.4261 Transcript_3099/m.4261 type:complete len:255 (-) Transcript_3099:510-1274(-)
MIVLFKGWLRLPLISVKRLERTYVLTCSWMGTTFEFRNTLLITWEAIVIVLLDSIPSLVVSTHAFLVKCGTTTLLQPTSCTEVTPPQLPQNSPGGPDLQQISSARRLQPPVSQRTSLRQLLFARTSRRLPQPERLQQAPLLLPLRRLRKGQLRHLFPFPTMLWLHHHLRLFCLSLPLLSFPTRPQIQRHRQRNLQQQHPRDPQRDRRLDHQQDRRLGRQRHLRQDHQRLLQRLRQRHLQRHHPLESRRLLQRLP